MKVEIYYFAQAHEIVGESQAEFEISEGADVSDLISKLQSQYKDFLTLQFRVAVNSDYVENTYVLHDGDEVAIIPPISGG
jgi:molybdopterin synthase sulfur carrier subunit